jgi:glycosyltransferase involved in cell wall biosynthesis
VVALKGLKAMARGPAPDGRARLFGERTAEITEPVVVSLTKEHLGDPSSRWRQDRVAVHDRHVRTIWVIRGKTRKITAERIGGCVLVSFPTLRPRFVSSALYYSFGALLAVGLAVRYAPSAVVCQSPLEGVGVTSLARLAPRSRRPVVQIEIHADWGSAPRLYGSRARHLLAPLSDRACAWAVRHADRVRVVADVWETQVRATGYRGPIDKYIEFADYSTFLEGDPLPIPDKPRVVFAGVLERYKGIDVLVSAWPAVLSEVPNAELVIAGHGNGTLAPALKKQVARQGVDASVRFTGHVRASELRRLIDEASCLVLPSRSEGLGRVVLEAMARGRPVVGSAVGGLTEVIEEDKTGHLVPPGQPEALAEALVDILHDPVKANRMGLEGRKRVAGRDPGCEYEAGIERLAEWVRSAGA